MEKRPANPERSERGKPASFDPRSGEVHGSGSGAGGGGNPDEDFDSDPMAGAGQEPAENRQLDQRADSLLEDQQQHQDRGQGSIENAQQR